MLPTNEGLNQDCCHGNKIFYVFQLIQDFFISQSDRTDLQAQIGTDSQEYDIIKDDLHSFALF